MRIIQNSIFFLLFFSLTAFSQDNDFQTWHSISLNKKVLKKTNFSIKSGLRLRENSSLFSKQFTDFRIKRKYNKRFSFSFGYRYINNSNEQLSVFNQNRFYIDVNYKNKFTKRLLYSVRNRWQTQGNISSYNMTLRQKFGMEYNIRKTKLYVGTACEYFLRKKGQINKLRSTLLLGYPITKKLDFELNYRIQNEFFVNNPITLYIFEGKIAYGL